MLPTAAHVKQVYLGQDGLLAHVSQGVLLIDSSTIDPLSAREVATLATAQGPRKIRLDSIDAPETDHGPGQPGQPFGEASRKHLASLVAGRRLSAT